MTQGRRAYPDAQGVLHLAEGEYGRGKDGVWYCRPPGLHMGSLENHRVVEHEDGTITVSPSILFEQQTGDTKRCWHGYLSVGVWL